MRYSTNILTTLIVISTATAANAQDFFGLFRPATPSYGAMQTNYGYTTQPYLSSSPCATGNCPQPYTTQYRPVSNYGVSNYVAPANCANGQCLSPTTTFMNGIGSNCINGNCSTSGICQTNPELCNCPNGNCRAFPAGRSDYSTPVYSPRIPGGQFNQGYPSPYGSVGLPQNNTPFQINVNRNVPVNYTPGYSNYGTTNVSPISNSPYYN